MGRADGEPYVNRYELNKAKALLDQLGTDIPNLPRYNSAKDEKFPWEGEVELTFKRLRRQRHGRYGGYRPACHS